MKTKINLSLMIITSILCLLPLILSFMVYKDLPEKIGFPIWNHNPEGNFNYYVHKAYPAFSGPLAWLVFNIILKIIMQKDEKKNKYPKETLTILDWAPPVCSLFTVPLILFMAMGAKIPYLKIVFILGGILFIVYGNYLPKTKQKKAYTSIFFRHLNDPDIFNKTHRMYGYAYMIGGAMLIAASFLSLKEYILYVIMCIIFVLVLIVPVLYSVFLYTSRKQMRN